MTSDQFPPRVKQSLPQNGRLYVMMFARISVVVGSVTRRVMVRQTRRSGRRPDTHRGQVSNLPLHEFVKGVQRGEDPLPRALEALHPLLSPLPSRERKAHVEVQEGTSCRGCGGVPQFSLFSPQEWGIKGVESINGDGDTENLGALDSRFCGNDRRGCPLILSITS